VENTYSAYSRREEDLLLIKVYLLIKKMEKYEDETGEYIELNQAHDFILFSWERSKKTKRR